MRPPSRACSAARARDPVSEGSWLASRGRAASSERTVCAAKSATPSTESRPPSRRLLMRVLAIVLEHPQPKPQVMKLGGAIAAPGAPAHGEPEYAAPAVRSGRTPGRHQLGPALSQ